MAQNCRGLCARPQYSFSGSDEAKTINKKKITGFILYKAGGVFCARCQKAVKRLCLVKHRCPCCSVQVRDGPRRRKDREQKARY